nr:glucose dehydrogenase [FAD, quinone]-like [Aedes albopictus]
MILRCWEVVLLVVVLINAETSTADFEDVSRENLIEGIDEFEKVQSVETIKNDFISEMKDIYSDKNILNQYDFVIVGASPTGCVLANRLTENPEWKVLLLEAGERENLFVKVPVFAAYMQSTSYNWGYVAEPQNYSCWGMKDQRCAMPRGKGLGGSTLINYMMYVRGNRHDFDSWAAQGNPGWSYEGRSSILQKVRKIVS